LKIQQFSIDYTSKNKRLQTEIPLLLYVTGGARYHPLNKFVNLNLCPSLTNFVVTVVQPHEFLEEKLSWAEIEALRNFKTSEGYLKDLFLLNDFRFWNRLELSRKQEETSGHFFIGDLVKLEIGHCKLGYMKFNEWVRELEPNPNLIVSFNLENERIPDVHNYGRLMTNIGSDN